MLVSAPSSALLSRGLNLMSAHIIGVAARRVIPCPLSRRIRADREDAGCAARPLACAAPADRVPLSCRAAGDLPSACRNFPRVCCAWTRHDGDVESYCAPTGSTFARQPLKLSMPHRHCTRGTYSKGSTHGRRCHPWSARFARRIRCYTAGKTRPRGVRDGHRLECMVLIASSTERTASGRRRAAPADAVADSFLAGPKTRTLDGFLSLGFGAFAKSRDAPAQKVDEDSLAGTRCVETGDLFAGPWATTWRPARSATVRRLSRRACARRLLAAGRS